MIAKENTANSIATMPRRRSWRWPVTSMLNVASVELMGASMPDRPLQELIAIDRAYRHLQRAAAAGQGERYLDARGSQGPERPIELGQGTDRLGGEVGEQIALAQIGELCGAPRGDAGDEHAAGDVDRIHAEPRSGRARRPPLRP